MKYSEGLVTINVPGRKLPTKKDEVFLNENKKFDRDIHILLLNSLGWKNKTYLDLMSASGLRAIRVAKETNCFKTVYANDYKKSALKSIKKNAENNNVNLELLNFDAKHLLCSDNIGGLDYIDVDPYGSPIYFIVDAMRRLSRGGIISVCATDTGALSGTYHSTCKRRYHSNSYLSEFYYESGIRILAKECINLCSTYDVALVPVFAHATRHYFRIYFKKVKGAKQADKLIKQIDSISYCPKCLHREVGVIEKCECGSKVEIIGPMFIGNLFDNYLVKKMSKKKEYEDFFSKILEEGENVMPWFYTTDRIAKKYKIVEPRMRDLKYARTHISPKGFKTNKDIKEIVKSLKK